MVTRPKHRARIQAQKTGALLPFNSSHAAARLGLPLKPSIILIRWPVVIIASYLLLYPATRYLPESFFHAFILLYVISNVALYFLDDPWFGSWSFYYPLVITDTLVLTMSLIINGRAETDFYFTFFLLIIASCILEDAKLRAAISLLAPVVYLGLRVQSGENIDPGIYLRLPFLFVVSLFYGYFTQFIRTEKALREDAEKRNQGKKEMLDIVSHEFRTPLNLIGGYAQALKSKTLGELTKEQEHALAKILGQSENLLYLVNSVLDLTRIEAGQMSVEREVIELPEYLREMRLRYEMPLDKPVSLKWSVASDLQAISSDRGKLTLILQNLINNAIKFTEEGTIHVSARRAEDKKGVEFEIADTGIGIPKEALPVIFDKFRQADSSSTRVHGGVGLGLHIVYVFTELLGGSIDVETELDHGSIFTLWLPA
jgi:signal transduction histidine kinase